MRSKIKYDVQEFKRLVAEGWSRKELAVRFDVNSSTIGSGNGKTG